MQEVILETGEHRRDVVRKAVERLGEDFIDRIKSTETILLKVNLVHHEHQLASTHIDAVRGVVDVIRLHSRAQVYVGDASFHGTVSAFSHFGYDQLLSEYDGVHLIDLNEDETVDGYSLKRDGSKNSIKRSALAHSVDLRISLAPMKVHRDMGVSLSVKNWTVGTWVVPPRNSHLGRVWARWPWLYEEGPWAMHTSVAELYEQLPCDIAIVDGMQAMEGDGPTEGTAVAMNTVLAGFDAVAVDAVAATLMGFDPGDIGYLTIAAEKGLGSIDMTKIDVPPIELAQRTRAFLRPPVLADRLLAWKSEDPRVTISSINE
jgi:uncharacterized protein (DUF362 family)